MELMGRQAAKISAFFCALLAAWVVWIPPAAAQDALTVAPKVFRKVTENSRMRVLEATFRPGEKVGAHTLSDHLLYMLTDGTLVLKPAGRTAYEMNFKPGEALFLPAQTRAAENGGNKTVRALIVELKSAPAAQSRAKARGKRTGRKRSGRRRR
jgi:quercetin dioxygenase-like cupin family protein